MRSPERIAPPTGGAGEIIRQPRPSVHQGSFAQSKYQTIEAKQVSSDGNFVGNW